MLKTVTPDNPQVNDKWYNIRHSKVQVLSPSRRAELLCPTSTSTKNMGEKSQENSVMGYSAAYPTGRELGEKWVSEGVGEL